MLMRCKRENIKITEHLSTNNYFFRGEGDRWLAEKWADEPAPTGEISVQCFDCGFNKHYSLRAKRPKWLKIYLEKAFEL